MKDHVASSPKKGKDFSPISLSCYKGYVSNAWIKSGLCDLLAQLPDSLKRPGVTTIKDSRTTSLFRIAVSFQPDPALRTPHSAICVKRYNYQNFFYALKYFFRQSRATQAWVKTNILLNLGLPIPSPLVCLEKRVFGFLHHSIFITTWINDALALESFFEEHFGDSLTGGRLKEKWQFISEAARYIKTIHDLQITHGDLKAKNILVKLIDGTYFFYLLDLDSLKIKKSLGWKERIRDLARLNASFQNMRVLSRSNRLRFLISYFRGEPLSDSPKRFYWQQIAAATENTLRKSGKRFM